MAYVRAKLRGIFFVLECADATVEKRKGFIKRAHSPEGGIRMKMFL